MSLRDLLRTISRIFGSTAVEPEATALDVIVNPGDTASIPQILTPKQMEFTQKDLNSILYNDPIIAPPSDPVVLGGGK